MRLAMDLNQSRAQTDRLWRVARGNGKRAAKKRPRNFDQWHKQLVEDGVLPDICQGTRTFTRLRDTNCYEVNR